MSTFQSQPPFTQSALFEEEKHKACFNRVQKQTSSHSYPQNHSSSYSISKIPNDLAAMSQSSSELSPFDLLYQHLSTQSNSPDYDQAISSSAQLSNVPSYHNSQHSQNNQPQLEGTSQNWRQNNIAECPDVEDFSIYLSQIAEPRTQAQNDDLNEERLFGNKLGYVPKYAYTIVQNLFMLQNKYSNTEVTDTRELILRESLMDLMSAMHSHLKLQDETFFLGTNVFARYMQGQKVTSVASTQLAVLVATCLFVAAKYQEIYPPPLSDFVQLLTQYSFPNQSVITDLNSHKKQFHTSILQFEGDILIKLQFALFGPTRLQFLEAYISQTNLDASQRSFCTYLLELSQLNHSFYKYAHSEVAAAVILLSEKFKNISGKFFWSAELELLSNYKQPDLYACVEDLYSYLVVVTHQKRRLNIYMKYSDPRLKGVALIDYDLSHNLNNSSTTMKASNANNQSSITIQQQQQQQHNKSTQPQPQQLTTQYQQPAPYKKPQQFQLNSYTKPHNETSFQKHYDSSNSSDIETSSSSQLSETQYFSMQEFQSSRQPVSKAKSECINMHHRNAEMENTSDFEMACFSELRPFHQTTKQYDITRYLQNINKPTQSKQAFQ